MRVCLLNCPQRRRKKEKIILAKLFPCNYFKSIRQTSLTHILPVDQKTPTFLRVFASEKQTTKLKKLYSCKWAAYTEQCFKNHSLGTLFPSAPAGPCTKHTIRGHYLQAAQSNLTWVSVQVTLHSFPNTLQFNSLKGLIPVHDCWQAAQSIVNQICHFSHIKELQKFRVHRWERAEKHSLEEQGKKWTVRIVLTFTEFK